MSDGLPAVSFPLHPRQLDVRPLNPGQPVSKAVASYQRRRLRTAGAVGSTDDDPVADPREHRLLKLNRDSFRRHGLRYQWNDKPGRMRSVGWAVSHYRPCGEAISSAAIAAPTDASAAIATAQATKNWWPISAPLNSGAVMLAPDISD